MTPPLRMTRRARGYLWTCAIQSLLLSAVLGFLSARLSSQAFSGLVSLNVPLAAWAVVFLGAGVFAGFAAVRGELAYAYVALIGSAVLSAFWVAGFVASALAGARLTYISLIAFGSLCVKDLLMVRNPLADPFEPALDHIDHITEELHRSTSD